jgi:hypothetical protein
MSSQFVVDPPHVGFFPAFSTPAGIISSLPPGARIAAYVRSTGAQSGDDITIGNNLVTTLAVGLARCRSGFGDAVIVLPGHAENVTTTPTFVAGARIIGIPLGTATPAFTWTATDSQWAISVANVSISGLKLNISGANGVVKGIAITGAHCYIQGCEIHLATGAALKATIGIEAGAGADDFKFNNNRVYGTATHNVTDGVLIAAATVRNEVIGNRMQASATAANGLVRVSAAALQLDISHNRIYNTHTSSTACIAIGNVAADGVCSFNHTYNVNDGVATAQGIIFGAAALVKNIENYQCDEAKESGLLTPAAQTN